jgi:hypothetical protein
MNKLYRVALGCGALLLAAPAVQAQPTTEEKIEILTQEVEQLRREMREGAGAGASRVNIGGYGELHYNNIEGDAEIDFHRFVLFFGHQFTDRIRFFSELEVEHALAGDGQPGEVELEQAFIDFDLSDNHTARGGLFLIPVGILNETHEPPTFYGVERNPVENQIIPTTWWEGGAMLYGRLGAGLSYDFALTSGLEMDPTTFSVRGGRQKVAEANAENLAYTGRLRWTGAPGVELATTVQYQQNVTQGAVDEASAVLTEAHVIYARGPFALRALYARWDIDGAAAEAIGADEQTGWYIEPSFKITPQVGVFARYNEWDTRAGNDGVDTVNEQTNFGVNYWPIPQVVLKADFEKRETAAGDVDGFNLGIGYIF